MSHRLVTVHCTVYTFACSSCWTMYTSCSQNLGYFLFSCCNLFARNEEIKWVSLGEEEEELYESVCVCVWERVRKGRVSVRLGRRSTFHSLTTVTNNCACSIWRRTRSFTTSIFLSFCFSSFLLCVILFQAVFVRYSGYSCSVVRKWSLLSLKITFFPVFSSSSSRLSRQKMSLWQMFFLLFLLGFRLSAYSPFPLLGLRFVSLLF